jgi:cytochrome bd ubiquinol oxidase subunit I
MTLRAGVWAAAVLAPLQILAGDLHGLNTLEHQPAKIAAMEAVWKTQAGAPLVLFAVPNELAGRNDYSIEIPKLASFVLKHDFDAEIQGLEEFMPDIPPVAPVFYAFRLMVGVGVLMLAVAWLGAWWLRKRAPPRWLLWTFAGMTFSGWIATLAGWIVTEIGRQPWLVTGILRTADAVGQVPEAAIGASLTGYLLVYSVMLLAYMVVLTHMAGEGAKA